MAKLGLQFDRGPWRRQLHFPTTDELEDFLDLEDRTWAWTKDEKLPNYSRTLIGTYATWVEGARAQLKAYVNDNSDASRQGLNGILHRRFVEHSFVAAIDPAAAAITRIAEADLRAAAIALAVVEGRQIEAQRRQTDPSVRSGHAQGLAILAGVSPELASAAQAAFHESDRQLSARLAEFAANLETHRAESDKAIAEVASQGTTAVAGMASEFAEQTKGRNEEFNKLKAELEATVALYNRFMELQGPVTYWRKKSAVHKKQAATMAKILMVYCAAALVILFGVFAYTASFLPTESDKIPVATLFKAGAFSILVTTVLFWTGRILVKMYLSDRHLSIDADERRTMIMTFLALTRKEKADEKDRAIILAAIFRAGSDGIVKDEGGPDTALATAIGNLIRR